MLLRSIRKCNLILNRQLLSHFHPTFPLLFSVSESDYHKIADQYLDDLFENLDQLEANEALDFECSFSQGVLTLSSLHHGTWVINKQAPNKQLWWSSPISGPKRFEFDDEEGGWMGTRDGEEELEELLKKEIKKVSGIDLTTDIN